MTAEPVSSRDRCRIADYFPSHCDVKCAFSFQKPLSEQFRNKKNQGPARTALQPSRKNSLPSNNGLS